MTLFLYSADPGRCLKDNQSEALLARVKKLMSTEAEGLGQGTQCSRITTSVGYLLYFPPDSLSSTLHPALGPGG